MRQQSFEAHHNAEWQRFSDQLERLEKRKKVPDDAVSAFPSAYRHLCGQLAVARQRHYSNHLIEHLSGLVLRGYQLLYRAPRGRWTALLAFIGAELPRLVRREAYLFWFCAALFYLPLLVMGMLVYAMPELIYSLLDPAQVANIDAMYRPGNRIRDERPAESDVLMFGFYIYNNIGIGFRTFAGGVLFAIGSVFILLFNGTFIGAIAGYLTERGYWETFYPFVIAHGAFELTGIVLAGAAGMKLGLALLAPGRYSRLEALKRNAKTAVKLIYGVIVLLVIAAFVEAFWSSKDHLSLTLRYVSGGACWLAVIGYFLGAGRRAA